MNLPRRFFNWFTWQRVSVQQFIINEPKREAITASIYAVVYVFIAAIIGYLITIKPLPILGSASFLTTVWYALVFKIGFLLIVPSTWFFLRGYRIRDLLPDWKLSFRSVLAIIFAYVLGVSINLLQGHFSFILEVADNFSASEFIIRVGIGFILPLLMAAIPEEFFYRGILQTRIEQLLGRIAAIVITVLLFTAWHITTRFLLSQGVEGYAGDFGSVLLGTGVPVLIFGLLFGLLWDRYRNLLSLIAFHWGIDTLPILISMVGVDY